MEMCKYGVCIGVEMGFCEGGCKKSCPLTRVSVRRASTVFIVLINMNDCLFS